MFCLGCGAELTARAEVCAVCGRPAHPESPMSPRAPQRATSAAPRVATNAAVGNSPSLMRRAAIPVPPPRGLAAPSVSSGDLGLFALPGDVTGRLVVVLPLLLAADLLAPWIILGDAQIAPARAGFFALVIALPFALIAAMTVYLPFRQRPVLAAIPMVVSALALGGGLILLLMVGPYGGRVVSLIGGGTIARLNVFIVSGTQTPIPGPLPLAPDIGLYAFIVGAGVLVVASYRRLDALITSQYSAAAPVMTPATAPASSEQASEEAPKIQVGRASGANPSGTQSAENQRSAPSTPLPGTPGWNEAPQLPAIVRNAPPIRGMRRIEPR
jgi:hypothetical protein